MSGSLSSDAFSPSDSSVRLSLPKGAQGALFWPSLLSPLLPTSPQLLGLTAPPPPLPDLGGVTGAQSSRSESTLRGAARTPGILG